MKNFVLILTLLPMLVLNFAPVSSAVADGLPGKTQETPVSDTNSHKKNKDRNIWSLYLEILNETETDEKFLSFQGFQNQSITSQYGFKPKDQYAIPNQRTYLPDEPPIA